MKIFLSYRERAAGLFLLFAFALVLVFVLGAAAQNRWFTLRVRFHTQVERGDGLREGSPILLSGVEVGEIGSLRIMEDDRIDVELLVLSEHAPRVRKGTTATVRRLLGIGEKRVHLTTARGVHEPLAAGALLPAEEPLDLIDLVGTVNLGQSVRVLERSLSAMEMFLGTLEEGDRFGRMVGALDRIGPTLEKVDKLLDDVHEPLVTVINDPNLRGTLRGANVVLNEPATRKTLQSASALLDEKRIGPLLARSELLLLQLETLTADKGVLTATLQNANKLLTDGRTDRLITSLERLTDEKKLGRIVDNMAVLAEQMARIGPEIPSLTRDMAQTLKEAVVVLKALQKTWILNDQVREVRQGEGRK